MPIAALSGKDVDSISSTLVLNDAISVIKELIDNALDANATTIVIEISANTLDIIQVKDNGTGIGVEDRQLLCKRGFTSKIRTLDDLAQLGGTFLGFRGEALASVSILSDSVTFTTRIDGETVGTLLKFGSNGKLVSSSSASHGTGTTVRVSEFLKSIPVRRQTATKQATKILSSVKRLLFDYAFARPTVKFRFKVLKSGGDLKANWSFAPGNDAGNLNTLASKIVGKDVAAQCEQATISSDDGDYKIDALLFAQDADISKCGGSDRFISIDGRPLAADCDSMKGFTKVYKSYVSSVLPDGVTVPNKIFLLVRLGFPRGSYDVNIEPAKNEVMFEDSGLVLDLFERLCKSTYGEKTTQLSTKKGAPNKRIESTADFGVLLAKKTPLPEPASEPKGISNPLPNLEDQEPQERRVLSHESDVSKKTKVFRSMYGVDEQDLLAPRIEDDPASEKEISEEVEDIMDPQVTNPFTLAKVNTLLKPRNMSDSKCPSNPTPHDKNRDINNQSNIFTGILPSPSPSPGRNMIYQNPGPPNRPWKNRRASNENGQGGIVSPVSLQPSSEPERPTLLDNWTKSINSSSPLQASASTIEVRRSEPMNVPARMAMQPTISSIQKQTPSKRPSGLSATPQSAFRTPFNRSSNVGSNSPTPGGQLIRSHSATRPMQHMESPSLAEGNGSRFPGFERPRVLLDTELDEIMDFEHRKRSTILEHRENMRQIRSDKGLKRGEQTHGQVLSVPARPETEGVHLRDHETNYGSKFGQGDDEMEIPAQPSSASYTQNPHQNRYKKALRDLEDRTEKQATEDEHVPESDGKGQTEQRVRLSAKDPRAYLIRLANEKGAQEHGNALKPKKSTIAKLPFEMIEPTMATYTYTGFIGPDLMEDTRRLSNRVRTLNKVDSYVHDGKIYSDMLEGKTTEDIVQQWEDKVHSLLVGANVVEFGTFHEDSDLVAGE